MQMLKPHPRPTEVETLGLGLDPATCALTSLSAVWDAH